MPNTVLYLLRHGETEWALSGRHTGRTDISLTAKGRQQAALLSDYISKLSFSKVLVSPLTRAQETAKLAGLSNFVVCADLAEFDYGDCEGLTTAEIRKNVPDWTVWTHPCSNGETLEQVRARACKAIALANEAGGNVALVSHGHMLRILTATWLQLPPSEGRHFMLDTGTVSILSHERETPAIKLWNAPVMDR
ncbi:MAG: histidine phosphatase family protein [Candidatus Obscuribacterales bacterium]|nr:histidine phosphatase family protein [Candidatus Obscuribacterales bacterium]